MSKLNSKPKTRRKIRVKGAIVKRECIIIPSFAVMDELFYYGYTVIALAFGWLWFRFKIEFGVQIDKF